MTKAEELENSFGLGLDKGGAGQINFFSGRASRPFFSALAIRMDCGVYMRKLQNTRSYVTGFKNGQDASQVTLKNQARSQTVKVPTPVATSFAKIGGPVSVTQATQQTCSPTTCASGYKGVANGNTTTDATANVLGAKLFCAVSSDALSSAPYATTVPCGIFINPVSYNPDTTSPGTKPEAICCRNDTSQVYRNNSELIADQGRQLTIRNSYNLPNKLQGLRGPVMNR